MRPPWTILTNRPQLSVPRPKDSRSQLTELWEIRNYFFKKLIVLIKHQKENPRDKKNFEEAGSNPCCNVPGTPWLGRDSQFHWKLSMWRSHDGGLKIREKQKTIKTKTNKTSLNTLGIRHYPARVLCSLKILLLSWVSLKKIHHLWMPLTLSSSYI